MTLPRCRFGRAQKTSLICTLGILLLLRQPVSAEQLLSSTSSQNPVYTDRNNYFSFVPPKGWTEQEYSDDPRTKLAFVLPGAQNVYFHIVAAVAPPFMNAGNFVSLMREDMETLRARMGSRFYEIKLREGTFGGYPAAFVRQSFPEGEQEITLFLAGNMFFNIPYYAPDTETLGKYREVVQRSLATILVRNPVDTKHTQEQRVARYLTLARALTEMNNYEGAESYLEDGLREYPGDVQLQEALKLVKQKKSIQSDAEP